MIARVHVETPDGVAFDRDLESADIVIGRAPTANVVVADSSVSRHHARIFFRDGKWWAEDLGATNGTLLNDEPLKAAVPLGAGDRLRLGGSVVTFVPQSAAEPVVPAPATAAATAGAARTGPTAVPDEARPQAGLEPELAIARDIQLSTLARVMPQRPEIRVAATLTPGTTAGGDLYDFILDGESIWFTVADVTGKGVPAVLRMVIATTVFRTAVQTQRDVVDVVRVMNTALCRNNDRKFFTTAVVGRMLFETGNVVMAEVGHCPALLVGPRGDISDVRLPKNFAFGVHEDARFEVGSFKLDPGGVLVLHTKSATGALNASGEVFGADRLRNAVKSSSGRTPEDLVHGTLQAIQKFAAGAPPKDDLTLLAVEYLGTEITFR